ncbi:MAG: hypothetical protein WC889_15030, partial [Myxococcota bacterium]
MGALGIPTGEGGEAAPVAAPPPKPSSSSLSKEPRAFESEDSATSEFGDFDGYFRADVQDEEGKISVRNFEGLSGMRTLAMTELMTLVMPAKYNYIFENRDMDGMYTSRLELIGALKDYQSATGKMFDFISQTESGAPVDLYYQKLEPPYQPKLAPYDTLEELRMARGVGDEFFGLFGDRLTIYPVSKINLASADDLMIAALVCGFIKDKNHPFCTDTTWSTQRTVLERFRQFKQLKAASNIFYTASLADIREFFTSEGILLNDSMFGLGKIEDSVTDSSSFFTIRAEGRAGNVTKHITAVVYTGGGAGDILYWRED